tara:strand:- start:878 stop:1216 length:339 start_codon:yes stop_codon:yes gene_type:complete
MTTRDLVLEFKANIQDLQKEKADMAKTIASKESRIKQILIKLEQTNSDLEHAGKHAAKVQKDNDVLKSDNTTLKAKLETTEKLLDTATTRLKALEGHIEEDPEEDEDTESEQ